jgi:hypothetical protein
MRNDAQLIGLDRFNGNVAPSINYIIIRDGALKKIAPSGGRREICLGISCEKSRFYAKKIIFFPILGAPPPPSLDPPLIMSIRFVKVNRLFITQLIKRLKTVT